ncbi:hypothetical protein YPPY53_1032, partial [Yersinia pestis PY-53]
MLFWYVPSSVIKITLRYNVTLFTLK